MLTTYVLRSKHGNIHQKPKKPKNHSEMYCFWFCIPKKTINPLVLLVAFVSGTRDKHVAHDRSPQRGAVLLPGIPFLYLSFSTIT